MTESSKMEKTTAIIMAGGKSTRMGQDKALLSINGVPAIRYVCDQLKPYFDEILISSNNPKEHGIDAIKVVLDEIDGKGPLVGIASALRVSQNQINFVIACDIPEVDITAVKQLISKIDGFDAVIPKTGPSRYEPLFAVYRKNVLAEIDKAITGEKYRIIEALENCKVNYIDFHGDLRLRNLNTINDYREFLDEGTTQ